MLKYWSNICTMLGVALIATAFFQEHWQSGTLLGVYTIGLGAWMHGLSLSAKGEKR
ncbi:MAG: hypothetical protein IJC28_03415 [Mailhella sp.]|nr:hypothetical protein [Mailhella sp.]MBQ4325946.1 hypothetical protein [Mailhella sp.]